MREVGEADLDARPSRPDEPCPAHPGRHLLRQAQQLARGSPRGRRRRGRRSPRRRRCARAPGRSTDRGSRPQARSARWLPAAWPSARSRVSRGGVGDVARRCAARAGAAAPRSAPPPPTAHRPAGGAGTTITRSAGTTSSPSGLHRVRGELGDELRGGHTDRAGDALLVVDLGPDRARRSRGRLPRRRRAPATSRKASSRLSGSTSGVIERKISMTRGRDLGCSARWSGGTMTVSGARRRARLIGIAEWMPRRGPRRWPRARHRDCRRRRR